MTRRPKRRLIFGIATIMVFAFRATVLAEASSHAALQELWDDHMLKGEAGYVEIRDSRIDKNVWIPSTSSFQPWAGGPWMIPDSYLLQVRRLDEGFWRNGGWILRGGLLANTRVESSTLELYGKAVRHQSPYIPFPFHRAIPHETGYEFFLVHRPLESSQARIIRRWAVSPADVIVARDAHGVISDRVRATLKYENSTRTATVSIAGLKHDVVDRVQLAADVK